MLEESFEAVTGGQVIDQVFHRDTSPRKHWRTSEHTWVAPDDGFKGWHVTMAFQVHGTTNRGTVPNTTSFPNPSDSRSWRPLKAAE